MLSHTDQLKAAILAQNPTDQQKDAIFSEDLEFLLRAAPGSGKTWTSCRRFIWRAANWPYASGGLALLSFTNTAICEFKDATVNIGRSELLSDPNYVGTFDSFVERYILAPFGHLLFKADRRPKLFTGPRPGDRNNKKLKVWVNSKKTPVMAWDIVPYLDDNNKNRFKTPKGSLLETNAAKGAVSALLSLGFYTHKQRVFWACKLLIKFPHLAQVLARRFPEIIVDEAQDSNTWLIVLLNYLRNKGTKITLVGDPDQCIYEFAMADAASLLRLKEKWSIPEKPLSKSFRCNNQIAGAARNIGDNFNFIGCGDKADDMHGAFIVRDTSEAFENSLRIFQRLAVQAGLAVNSTAVLCRGHSQLNSLRGERKYTKLQGMTKKLADAVFLRDSRHELRGASNIVEEVLREITGDDPLWEHIDTKIDSRDKARMDLAVWRFVKNKNQFPPVSQIGDQWVSSVRAGFENLIKDLDMQAVKLGRRIRINGLNKDEKTLPLFEAIEEFPAIRQDTIHQVKGESIDAVLTIGSSKFWNSVMTSVMDKKNTEDRRLAYVAMTRARHLLVVGLPETHFDKYYEMWKDWGFKIADS